MNTEFNTIQINKPKRNFFDLSHERKFSCNMGELVPILVQEVLPGDTFNVTNQQLVRFAPMLAPIMHKVDVFTHYFFVPNRLVWDNWEEFITGNQGESPSPVHPYITLANVPVGSVADYSGLPTGNFDPPIKVNALPFACMNRVWNEYYRDQNLQTEILSGCADGDNPHLVYSVTQSPLKRAWEHDYFTSALPWTQKGQEVLLTFDTEAEIPINWTDGFNTIAKDSDGNPLTYGLSGAGALTVNDTDAGQINLVTSPGTTTPVSFDNSANLSVDLAGSYLMSVNQLRQAMALQRWLELNARAGSRYIETILAHFGVKSPDARLQRPEYLGGGKSAVAISEVLQMSQSETTPQGTMSGHGINYGQSHEFKSYFTEHGHIIGLMSLRPRTAYQQGIPKHFLKNDKFDYFWTILAHLGEQAIENQELYAQHPDPTGTFGYVPRYSEYKFINSSVHGDFRTNLDFWHMGRIFATPPALNSDFISCNPTNRIFAVTDDDIDHIWVHLYQQIKAVRPIPVFSTPLLNG